MTKWKWLALAAVFAAVVGGQGWALKKQLARVCRHSMELAHNASAVRTWLVEAEADPFLGEGAMRGPVNSVVANYRERSGWIQSELSSYFLPEKVRLAFQAMHSAGQDFASVARALEEVASLKTVLQCGAREPAAEEIGLRGQVAVGNEFWRDQKALAILAKKEFAADRLIYCKSDELLRDLQSIIAVSEERCQNPSLPAHLSKACRAGKSEAILGEMADIEKQKKFNERKLRAKWPAPVLRNLQCS